VAEESSRQWLGAQLRQIRKRFQMPGEQVAAALGWSQSKVSRIETARIGISIADLTALLEFYAVPEDVRAELIGQARDGTGVAGAWMVRAGGCARRMLEINDIESRVAAIRQYALGSIPGLLQSPGYVAAIAAARPGERAGLAERRFARQQLLSGPAAPSYSAVLDERALLSWPDDRIRREQLAYLVERAQLPSISVRVLPAGRAFGVVPLHGLIIYDFPTGPRVVYVETDTADLYISEDGDAARYADLFDRAQHCALDERESMDLLRQID
jgi:transcriptional regulator with XRE-family HTH domain